MPVKNQSQGLQISIHALLAESDVGASESADFGHNFYPRSPCGERHARRALGFVDPDISIHALLAESDEVIAEMTEAQSISIHALLAESDCQVSPDTSSQQCISIHALLAESDPMISETVWLIIVFLSTLSLRRATFIIPARSQ